MTPEGKVKDGVKKVLIRCGVYALPDYGSNGCYFMPVQGHYAKKGIPDFILNVHGWFVAIETKANGEKPTDLQSLTLTAITLARGIALVIDDTNIGRLQEVLTNVIENRRVSVVQLSWRRQSLPTSNSHNKRPGIKSKIPGVERDRDWQKFRGRLGD